VVGSFGVCGYFDGSPPTVEILPDALGHILLSKQELNKIAMDVIYEKSIQITWTNPLGKLQLKMALFLEHFMELRDDLIV
jgi:hypothetical protein